MSDRYRTPPEIVAIIQKAGSGQALDEADRSTALRYLATAPGDEQPELMAYLQSLVGQPNPDDINTPNMREPTMDWAAPLGMVKDAIVDEFQDPFGGNPDLRTSGLTPSTAPSVADQAAAALAGAETAPVYVPGQGDLRSQAAAQTAPVSTSIDPYGLASNNNPGASPVQGSNTDVAPTNNAIGNEVPARGAGRDRTPRADRTDWKAERDRLNGVQIGSVPEGSAFAGIDPNLLPGLAQNPELAARLIAKQRGGGNASAALLAPQLGAALGLNATGVLTGGRHLGGASGGGDQLALAEQLVGSLGPGSYVDPGSVYRQTFKNVGRTPVNQMFDSQIGGDPGDISNQIAVTNGALATSTPYMTKDAADQLAALLQSAGDEYILGVAQGTIDPDAMSYPMWLKTEKKAKKWVGKGLTPDQVAAAF